MNTSEEEAASEPAATPRIRGVKTVFGLTVTSGYSIWSVQLTLK